MKRTLDGLGTGFAVKGEIQLYHFTVGIIVGVEGQVADLIILVIGGVVIEVIVVQRALADTDVVLFGIVVDVQLAAVIQALTGGELQAVEIAVFLLKEVPEVPLVEGDVVIGVYLPDNIGGLAAGLAAGCDLHSACHIAAAAGAVGGKGQLHGIFKVAVGLEGQAIQRVLVGGGDIAAVIVECGVLQIAVGELGGTAGERSLIKGVGIGPVKNYPVNIAGILLLEQFVEIRAAEVHGTAGLHLVGNGAGGAAFAVAVHRDFQGAVHIIRTLGAHKPEFQRHGAVRRVPVRHKGKAGQLAIAAAGNFTAGIVKPDIFHVIFIQRHGTTTLVRRRKIPVILQVAVVCKDQIGKTTATAAGIVVVQVSEIRAAELHFIIGIHIVIHICFGRGCRRDQTDDHDHGQQEGRQLRFP